MLKQSSRDFIIPANTDGKVKTSSDVCTVESLDVKLLLDGLRKLLAPRLILGITYDERGQ